MIWNQKKYNLIFTISLCLIAVLLFYTASTLSLSYKEALNVLDNNSVLSITTNIFRYFFGDNDIAVRSPFIILYVLSVVLMYFLTEDYFKKSFDRLVNVLIFMLLPGMLSAALLINSAIIVTFCLLVYLYYFKKYKKQNYYLLLFFLFVDNSFAILFLSLFFYGLYKKEDRLIYVSLLLFGISMYIYGFETTGKPKSYLLDTFAIYASVFSPFLFIYYLYSMYRLTIKGQRSLFWFISFTALIFSLLFSFRQKIYIEDFAPYVIITIPVMVKIFFNTLRVRLPEFRTRHYLLLKLTLGFLLITSTLTLYNKPIYLLLKNPEKHFVYDYHFAKEIAEILKKNEINNIKLFDKRLLKRLEFYGIKEGSEYLVSLNQIQNYTYLFKIEYHEKVLINIYVYKVKK